MKRQGLLSLVIGMVLLTGLAYAQEGNGAVAAANIPFAFTVHNATLPAGSYTIRSMNRGNETLWIKGDDAKAGMFVTPLHGNSGKTSDRTVLVFRKYGERYFLKSIERNGYSSGYQFPDSKVEKELRSQTTNDIQHAQNRTKPEEILVAAK